MRTKNTARERKTVPIPAAMRNRLACIVGLISSPPRTYRKFAISTGTRARTRPPAMMDPSCPDTLALTACIRI